MSLQTYELFNRQRGLFKLGELNNPKISKLEDLHLPKASILHFKAEGEQNGPSAKDPLFADIKRVIPMLTIKELDQENIEGNPRLLPGQPDSWIREYHSKNRQFRKVLDPLAGTKDINAPFVINYSLIERRYRYIKNAYELSYKWYNIHRTIFKQANKLANETTYNQFIQVTLPTHLPSISLLRQASKRMNLSLLKQFNDGDIFMVFEFWKWIGPNRQDSIFNLIEPKNYSKINFIITDTGTWTTFNLGTLDRWRKATTAELEENPEGNKKGFDPLKFQLLFVRYLMKFLLVRSGSVETINQLDEVITDSVVNNATDTKEIVDAKDVLAAKQNAANAPEVLENKKVGSKNVVDTDSTKPEEAVVQATPEKTTETNKSATVKPIEDSTEYSMDIGTGEFLVHADIEAALQADFEALDKMSEAREVEASDEGYVALLSSNVPKPDEAVMNVVNQVADTGNLSAAEYRRFETLGQRYKEIKFPGTDKTLEQMANISVEELKLEEPPTYKENATVFDKSMLQSKLDVFDKQYVTKVMDKDIANVLLSVQNAGICVTDVEKERNEDATGTYDTVRLKIQPVEGTASTLWMKLPVLDEQGRHKANNVTYASRKRRRDLPIRKVAPDKVALTSYYGKVTAIRSSKKVTDYGEWLRNDIMAKGLNTEDQTVINLQPANVYNNKLKTPRLYSLLSMRFRAFTLGGFDWYLDYKERTNKFTTEESKEFEKEGSLLVGKAKNGDLLLMDNKSFLYTVKTVGNVKQVLPAPTIEAMLDLDRTTAPIDIVGIKVLGKIIPIGFILAYHLGLEKLINSLGVKHRRIPKDTRVNLADDEYRLIFEDESLVFSRDDVLAAMILNGLKDYHKELKKYSVYEFNRPDVYLNLLEAVGLGARYLREIELLFKMFVDPITKGVLEEMREPTTFMGLLIRTTELLMTDDHPDEVDPEWMRIVGLEAIPGAMYNELVKAIRVHSSRPARRTTPVSMNPYDVWRAITTDPAVVVANEINPIKALKDSEAVTFGGTGGRTGRTMLGKTREYHENDLGTISEATVDSSDVGINIFMSANPNLTSVRGLTRRFDTTQDGASNILSTTLMLSPGADGDDETLCVVYKPL